MSAQNNTFDDEMNAIQIFNDVKESFGKQVKILSDLKREVTKTTMLDQGQKSKLRISIESLLIDLNEEIFAIAEEMAAAFSSRKLPGAQLLMKAQEFEEKKVIIFTKIRNSIWQNPSVITLKNQNDTSNYRNYNDYQNQNHSPPQRDRQTPVPFKKFLNESANSRGTAISVDPLQQSA